MKQQNPKSINLQFSHCKKVEISKFSNGDPEPPPQLLKVLSHPTDEMLTVVFEITKSQNSKNAQDIAVDLLGGQLVNSTVYLNIPDSQVLEKAKVIKLLCKFIAGSKSTSAYFRNRPINLYLLARKLTDIQSCASGQSTDRHTCYHKGSDAGWGCKYVTCIKKNLGKEVVKRNTNTYWYNFGYFNDKGEWMVDKELIRTVMFTQIEGDGINLCPRFSTKRILDNIQNLPDVIIVDNVNFKNQYRKDFIGSTLSVIPENIVHIPALPKHEKYEYEKSLKIKELEYLIGMQLLSGNELLKAKEQLLVLKGLHQEYAHKFQMDINPENGYRYSDN